MGVFDTILYPIKWVVAWILHLFHELWTFVGLDPASGWTWALSIVGLTVIMRILLIPLFFKQIKASRGMQVLQPELQKLQKKYKGKNDPASRQQMQSEMMALYQKHGTNPFASCLPILAQSPIFFALFRVLYSMPQIADGTYRDGEPLGPIGQAAASQFLDATLLGARLSQSFLGEGATLNVRILTAVLIVLMSVTTFTTQRQLTMKNMPQSALDNPMAKQQRMLMYLMPLIFAFSGVYFPIGVLIYWLTTNLWTMGQQFYTIRRMPAAGSEAEKRFKERERAKLERKAARKGVPVEELLPEPPEPERPVQKGQRVQPKRKDRQRRPGTPGATNGPSPTGASAASADDAVEAEPSAPAPSGSPADDGKTPQQRAAERHAKRAAQRRAEIERRGKGPSKPGK
ncbi:YidC/Oxa1 family membrane protein insertase [Georgenia satyanarayanai]|uniref:Membrane protein insertase YidC n=1 Tax=Georgenia satyanarayanai TaxID=860221 RepID=A0A2Y9ASQ3_9MICO|nr:membrane protein insertase YidC [Georgenia satyanarayanai]PYF97747.1 YidC/Oxa1 family membrane protein insertase [Georgenia satyanarayanai]SSA45487.1 YidC/Oxa1 family membrane protein insertase [Georgenia satyanarayanai]